MALPNLFVPGAPKSGTTALHKHLAGHPQIFMTGLKEPQYFCDPERFVAERTWYEELFAPSAGEPIRGESSTGYSLLLDSADRIADTVPDPKFVFVLRNPIDRAYSHYRWRCALGIEERPLREAFAADAHDPPDYHDWPIWRSRDELKPDDFRFYFQCGRYGTMVGHYIERFGADRVLVLANEDLSGDQAATLARCWAFLGVEPYEVEERRVHVTDDVAQGAPPPSAVGRLISGRGLGPRLRGVRRAVVGPVKRALPGVTRGTRDKLAPLTQAPPLVVDPLTAADREWLRTWYLDEVDLVRSITGQPFAQWDDFH
jgi:hypothetical protein